MIFIGIIIGFFVGYGKGYLDRDLRESKSYQEFEEWKYRMKKWLGKTTWNDIGDKEHRDVSRRGRNGDSSVK